METVEATDTGVCENNFPDGINKATPTKDAQAFANPGSCFLAPPVSAVVLTSNAGVCEKHTPLRRRAHVGR